MLKALIRSVSSALAVCREIDLEILKFVMGAARSRTAQTAEILFLRKQLPLRQEHQIRPRRFSDAARLSLVLWSRLFDWKKALVTVKPETLIRWHRKGFQLFWRWKSQAGRPRLPRRIRQLIAQMVHENPTLGQARVAAELSLKLAIYVSPRTARSYWPDWRGGFLATSAASPNPASRVQVDTASSGCIFNSDI
jgi:hypothetical protein